MIWSNPKVLEPLTFLFVGISWGLAIISDPSAVRTIAPSLAGLFTGYAAGWLKRNHPDRHRG